MVNTNDKKGLMIFGVLILVFLALSIAAYMTSGHMGIEERFNNAVGIHPNSEEEGPSGIFGLGLTQLAHLTMNNSVYLQICLLPHE
ncbi:Uncharacterised protein [uncultured archaeon]|nr:Uncharacterised protein [uncultured archaeon]